MPFISESELQDLHLRVSRVQEREHLLCAAIEHAQSDATDYGRGRMDASRIVRRLLAA